MTTILKNCLIVLSAAIASIGTYPYAKKFASNMPFSSQGILIATSIFVTTAVLSNIALGSFSILDTVKLCKETPRTRFLLISFIALSAALATGFICAVGYYETLSLRLNVLISAMVTLVNAAICFSAIHNASSHILNRGRDKGKTPRLKKALIFLTLIAALLASFVFYLATANGLLSIMDYYQLFEGYKTAMAYVASIIVWLPSAALFMNASRITVSQIYDGCKQKELSFSFPGFFIAIFALFSGSSYAQMTLEFFDTSKQIPHIFQLIASHNLLVLYGIMPITFIISGLVNAYALNGIIKKNANFPGTSSRA